MKKHSIRLLGGAVLATFALCTGLSAQTLNDTGSYRNVATAGLFKQEVDRVYDNPAYIGAKLDGKTYLEYEKSLTKEKTNVYTGMTGFNDNNRYLLGCSARENDRFGIAALVELGINKTPENVTLNRTVNGMNVSMTGQGKVEGIASQYNDTDADKNFDQYNVLTASLDKSTTENIVNAVFGLGGYKLGGATVGFSLERNADGSSTTNTDESYNFKSTNILTGFILSTINYTDGKKSSDKSTDYIAKLGAVIPMGAMPIESVLSVEVNKHEASVTDSSRMTNTLTGLSTQYSDYDIDTTVNEDGYALGLLFQTRMDMIGLKAQPYFKWANGGRSPFKSGKNYDLTYNETVQAGNSDYKNKITTENSMVFKGDRISANTISLGSNFRKFLADDLLLGFGTEYSFSKSTYKYKGDYTYTQISIQNNGNGAPDSGDYKRTTTGSYMQETEVSANYHTLSLPIGLEYAATPTLSFRLGYSFIGSFGKTDTNISVNTINARYNDYDYDSVTGNESTYDGLAQTTVDIPSAGHTLQKRNLMTNVYTAGIGYNLSNKVQLDLAFRAVDGLNFNYLNSSMVMTSATFVF